MTAYEKKREGERTTLVQRKCPILLLFSGFLLYADVGTSPRSAAALTGPFEKIAKKNVRFFFSARVISQLTKVRMLLRFGSREPLLVVVSQQFIEKTVEEI